MSLYSCLLLWSEILQKLFQSTYVPTPMMSTLWALNWHTGRVIRLWIKYWKTYLLFNVYSFSFNVHWKLPWYVGVFCTIYKNMQFCGTKYVETSPLKNTVYLKKIASGKKLWLSQSTYQYCWNFKQKWKWIVSFWI